MSLSDKSEINWDVLLCSTIPSVALKNSYTIRGTALAGLDERASKSFTGLYKYKIKGQIEREREKEREKRRRRGEREGREREREEVIEALIKYVFLP